MSVLERITHVANRAESLLHKATVEAPPLHHVLEAMPKPLAKLLDEHREGITNHLVRPPATMVIASAAKADLVPPPAGLAFSMDADGTTELHPPGPDGSIEVWVRRGAAQGRHFFTAGLREALDVIEHAEKKPALKHLPDRSSFPEMQNPPDPRNLRVAPEIVRILFDHRDAEPTPIPPGKPVLILVHGIFDRVFGFAFLPLLLWGDLLAELHQLYDGRVYGFDHQTLSVGPFQNAEDLAGLLPPETPIDILCHSRGGLVTRTLLQHPEFEDARKGLKLRNVIFMGAANVGSPLAEPDHLAQMLAIFESLFEHQAPKARKASHPDHLVNALKALLKPAADLPGLAALQPHSDLIGKLSGATTSREVRSTFIGANFGNATKLGLRAAELVSSRGFNGQPNDLVVPFAGMTKMGGDPPPADVLSLGNAATKQEDVYHLNYLESQKVRAHIKHFLNIT